MLYYLYNKVIQYDTGDEENIVICIVSILSYYKAMKWILVYIFGRDKVAGHL